MLPNLTSTGRIAVMWDTFFRTDLDPLFTSTTWSGVEFREFAALYLKHCLSDFRNQFQRHASILCSIFIRRISKQWITLPAPSVSTGTLQHQYVSSIPPRRLQRVFRKFLVVIRIQNIIGVPYDRDRARFTPLQVVCSTCDHSRQPIQGKVANQLCDQKHSTTVSCQKNTVFLLASHTHRSDLLKPESQSASYRNREHYRHTEQPR